MRRTIAISIVALALPLAVAGPRPALAQDDYFKEQTPTPLTYRIDGERSSTNKIVLASMAGGTLLVSGLGVLFHLESKRAADDVSALPPTFTSLIYSDEIDQRRQDGVTAKRWATVLYAVGAAGAIATVVTFIMTNPPDQVLEYKSGSDSRVSRRTFFAPTEGGALVGQTWTF